MYMVWSSTYRSKTISKNIKQIATIAYYDMTMNVKLYEMSTISSSLADIQILKSFFSRLKLKMETE